MHTSNRNCNTKALEKVFSENYLKISSLRKRF